MTFLSNSQYQTIFLPHLLPFTHQQSVSNNLSTTPSPFHSPTASIKQSFYHTFSLSLTNSQYQTIFLSHLLPFTHQQSVSNNLSTTPSPFHSPTVTSSPFHSPTFSNKQSFYHTFSLSLTNIQYQTIFLPHLLPFTHQNSATNFGQKIQQSAISKQSSVFAIICCCLLRTKLRSAIFFKNI